MATQHFKRNILLNLYREGKKISLVCFLLQLKRNKNVWHLQPISSIWRPLAFLPVTLSIPGLGRSLGEENGNPLQYSCLGNPMGRGDWQATVHGVAKSRT